MSRPKIVQMPDGTVWVERFKPIRRMEHGLIITMFLLLVLTGFPQKFQDVAFGQWVLGVIGGLDTARFIHRGAGIVFVAHAAAHLIAIVIGALTRRMRMTMLPTTSDVRDAWETLRYDLGHRPDSPPMPVFDYRQKFEYLGMVLGGLVMAFSGLALTFPVFVSQWIPGEIVLAMRVAHTYEASLAMLVLLIWHVYGSHLSPEVFPMDTSVFTGYISAVELSHRHAAEYRRLFGDAPVPGVNAPIRPCVTRDTYQTKPRQPPSSPSSSSSTA